MICASITESVVDEMVGTANSTDADVVEVRLDYLENFEGLERLSGVKKPLITSCMPRWEGGQFMGDEEERVSVLQKALCFSDYVSIELRTGEALRNRVIDEAKGAGVKVIVSYHDFRETPGREEILEILQREKGAGADIAKIAFMPGDYGDVLRTMDALLGNNLGIPVIALSMGGMGRVSRILGPLLGSYLTFASPCRGKESAPGQLTVDEVRSILGVLE